MRIFILSIILILTISGQNHWPSFRGAESRGISENADLPDKWSATRNVSWKTDIPGRGWSSPIVWGKKVFLTTVVNKGESESPKKGLYFGGNRLKIPESTHLWKVVCLDLTSGEILWNKDVHKGKPKSSIHLKNSYASETPVTDGELIYCYFGSLGLYAMDFEGQVVWTHKVPAYPTRYGWGTASSPTLHKDRVYLVNDNDKKSYLIALDKKNR
jgi:outer membrane protein assembly factor BamB